MKKSILLMILCSFSLNAYCDLDDWIGSGSSTTPRPDHFGLEKYIGEIEEKSSILDESIIGGSVAAFLINKTFDCNEYNLDTKKKSFKEELLESPAFKEITFKKKNDDQLKMTIDNLWGFKFAEVSLCNKEGEQYKCEAKKSEFISYLRISAKNIYSNKKLLLIERTVADKKGLETFPYAKGDSSRRAKFLIACSLK